MSHEIAKRELERARTDTERAAAIAAALRLSMPLNEIEEHLDWLDATRRAGACDASSKRAEGDHGDTRPGDTPHSA